MTLPLTNQQRDERPQAAPCALHRFAKIFPPTKLPQCSSAFAVLILSSALSIALHAQEMRTLEGHVLDTETKLPIPSATVIVQGTALGTSTDSSGYFLIEHIPPELFVIEVSHIAYHKTFRLMRPQVNDRSNWTIQLSPSDYPIAPTTVVGIADTARRKTQAAAAKVVTADEIRMSGVTTLTELLKRVEPTGGPARVRRNLDRPAFLIYVDGSYVPYIAGSLDAIVEVSQIDRIEVSRWVGAGANVGPGSSDRVVNIYTKKNALR